MCFITKLYVLSYEYKLSFDIWQAIQSLVKPKIHLYFIKMQRIKKNPRENKTTCCFQVQWSLKSCAPLTPTLFLNAKFKCSETMRPVCLILLRLFRVITNFIRCKSLIYPTLLNLPQHHCQELFAQSAELHLKKFSDSALTNNQELINYTQVSPISRTLCLLLTKLYLYF